MPSEAETNPSYNLHTSHSSKADCYLLHSVILQEKTTGKTRQVSVPVKEMVQEYIGGAETITEDPATRDYVVTRARLMAAKCVGGKFFKLFVSLCHM